MSPFYVTVFDVTVLRRDPLLGWRYVACWGNYGARSLRMTFQNNWVCPFKTTMYDPVLKIRLERDRGRSDLPSIKIFYDPEIVADHYAVPRTGRHLAEALADPYTRHLADFPMSFVSARSVQIGGISVGYYRHRDVFRFSAFSDGLIPFAEKHRNELAALKIPMVSDHPYEFWLHVLKSWYDLPSFEEEWYRQVHFDKTIPNIHRVEMCVDRKFGERVFGLSPARDELIVPDMYCIAAKEI
jgi:hypothetical protein